MMLLSNSLVPSKNTNGVLWEQQQGVDSHRKGLLCCEITKRHLQLCKRSKLQKYAQVKQAKLE